MEHRFLRLLTRTLPIMALQLLLSLMSSPTEAHNTLPADVANPFPLPLRVDSY